MLGNEFFWVDSGVSGVFKNSNLIWLKSNIVFIFFLRGEDNNVTSILLQEDLKDYGKIVDDQESENVNNYADYILTLLSQCQNGNICFLI